MSTFITREDGYFALTKPGYIALVILMLIIMFLTAFIVDKKQNAKKFQAKQLAFAGIALALAFITSYIKYELPMGGSLTLFSMFFICYIGYLYGVDTDETIGGTKVIQNGWISPRQICLTIIGLLLSTVLIGWWLIGHSGQEWLWGPVLFAVLSAVFYVAPPIRYGCRGYGELFVCLNMGFIMVMGSYAVMANGFSAQSLALALPVGLMVAGILYYQSLPEIETDLAAGKRTLANILGKAKAELVFKLWWPAVWVLMANLWACGLVGWPVFLGLLTFPLYWRACRLIHEAVEWLDLDQHGHLVRKLYLINGALLIAGVVLK